MRKASKGSVTGKSNQLQNRKCKPQSRFRGVVIVVLISCFLTACLLTGCGYAGMDMSSSQMNSSTSAGAVSEGYYGDYGMADMEFAYGEENWIETQPEVGDTTTQGLNNVSLNDRKLIRTVNMTVETKEYDTLLSTLETEVQSRGGYIESMDSYNGSSYSSYRSTRHASLTLRIPKAQLDNFLALISDIGNVVRRSDNVEDVTLSYVDLESRRNALRTEQERLLELLEMAESVEDIITIEDRLSSVRYQLESMESRLRTMDNQVDYSTVYMDVSEVQELTLVKEQTAWERISYGFVDSLKDIGHGAVEFAIWFLVNIPYLVIWAIVITVVVILIRGIRRKRRAKKAVNAMGMAVMQQGVVADSVPTGGSNQKQ